MIIEVDNKKVFASDAGQSFDKNKQTAVSESRSKFKSDGTEIISEGFKITEKGNVILFVGKTSLILKQ